jgi:lipase
VVRATKTNPPYITDDLLARLRERPDFTLLEFDCDHMVPLARPVETAAVIRKQLERG